MDLPRAYSNPEYMSFGELVYFLNEYKLTLNNANSNQSKRVKSPSNVNPPRPPNLRLYENCLLINKTQNISSTSTSSSLQSNATMIVKDISNKLLLKSPPKPLMTSSRLNLLSNKNKYWLNSQQQEIEEDDLIIEEENEEEEVEVEEMGLEPTMNNIIESTRITHNNIKSSPIIKYYKNNPNYYFINKKQNKQRQEEEEEEDEEIEIESPEQSLIINIAKEIQPPSPFKTNQPIKNNCESSSSSSSSFTPSKHCLFTSTEILLETQNFTKLKEDLIDRLFTSEDYCESYSSSTSSSSSSSESCSSTSTSGYKSNTSYNNSFHMNSSVQNQFELNQFIEMNKQRLDRLKERRLQLITTNTTTTTTNNNTNTNNNINSYQTNGI